MKLTLIGFLVVLFTSASAQISAVTNEGDEVVLYPNGTWRFVNDSLNNVNVANIPENKKTFTKSKEATFLLKSTKVNVGVHVNVKNWSFKKAEASESGEYTFEYKGGDGYGMLITERIELDMETLINVAVENAREVAPDIAIAHTEFRIVNGVKVLCMQMNGTIQGLKFTYFGYYYAKPSGTVQFLTYTSQNLFEEYKSEFENFLNGFVEL